MTNADVVLDRITALELLECLRSYEELVRDGWYELDRRSPLTAETTRLRQELERAIAERK